MKDAPVDPDRHINLWTPLPGDAGAHGRFDFQAKSRSVQVWMTMHALKLAIIVLVAGVAATVALNLVWS